MQKGVAETLERNITDVEIASIATYLVRMPVSCILRFHSRHLDKMHRRTWVLGSCMLLFWFCILLRRSCHIDSMIPMMTMLHRLQKQHRSHYIVRSALKYMYSLVDL